MPETAFHKQRSQISCYRIHPHALRRGGKGYIPPQDHTSFNAQSKQFGTVRTAARSETTIRLKLIVVDLRDTEFA